MHIHTGDYWGVVISGVANVVLFKTVKRAIDGRPFNWDKIARTAKMSKQTDKLMEGA